MKTLPAKYANALENEYLICFDNKEEAEQQIVKLKYIETICEGIDTIKQLRSAIDNLIAAWHKPNSRRSMHELGMDMDNAVKGAQRVLKDNK